MFWKIALVFFLTTFHLNAAELTVPKSFVNGEVADANDFNANNDYLVGKIEEEKTRIDQLLANAPWNNADEEGAIQKKIDCTVNQSALIEAYQANAHEDYLTFLLTGSCFGAYQWVQTVDDEGAPTLDRIQPKNQVVTIQSDRTTNPSNRAKLIPRKLIADRDYFVAGLVSSFGNGLYLRNLDMEMGLDDRWGILYSRSSNGGADSFTIKGNADPTAEQAGVIIQNGAAAYIGGSDTFESSIEGVATGIQMLGNSMGNIYGNLAITATDGLDTFNGGTFQMSLSADGKITGSNSAINLNQGAQGFINNNTSGVSIEGNISVSGSSLSIGGATVIKDDAEIALNNSTLNIWSENSGMSADRISCTGASVAGVVALSISNNEGNGCLDQAGWKTLIDSVFPPASASAAAQQPDLISSKATIESGPSTAGALKAAKQRSAERVLNNGSW